MTPSVSEDLRHPDYNNLEDVLQLDPSEIEEEIESDADLVMESDNDPEDVDNLESDTEPLHEVQLQNDSSAYFDLHKDSIFCIAQHPLDSNLIATGGSEGDEAGGMGYVFEASPKDSATFDENLQGVQVEKNGIQPIFKLEGHTDSISALAFTYPKGEVLLSAGLDGKLKAYTVKLPQTLGFLGEAQEVEEINWLAACPNQSRPNIVALGAGDGSVWVYSINPRSKDMPLQIIQSYFLHGGSCTAGCWTSDGKLLATVCEAGSLYVWDVFGEGAAAGITQGKGGAYVVGLSAIDQRFAVDGGLFSVAVAPNGKFLAAGGAGGCIKIVGLPILCSNIEDPIQAGKSNHRGGKQSSEKSNASRASKGQAGQILADLKAQTDGIETLAFSSLPLMLLAAGSVDGSIAIFDSAHQFAVRRLIREAHEDHSVVKVEFVPSRNTEGYFLTSCGLDGMVRRWDTRGSDGDGLVRKWQGHRGDGEGGGVLDFVQGDGSRIITAGDDGISLVFESRL